MSYISSVNPENYLQDPEGVMSGTGTLSTIGNQPVHVTPFGQTAGMPYNPATLSSNINSAYPGYYPSTTYPGGIYPGGYLGYSQYYGGGSYPGYGYANTGQFPGYGGLIPNTPGTAYGFNISNPYQAYGYGALNNPFFPPNYGMPYSQYGAGGNPFGYGPTIPSQIAASPPFVGGPGIGYGTGVGSYIGYYANIDDEAMSHSYDADDWGFGYPYGFDDYGFGGRHHHHHGFGEYGYGFGDYGYPGYGYGYGEYGYPYGYGVYFARQDHGGGHGGHGGFGGHGGGRGGHGGFGGHGGRGFGHGGRGGRGFGRHGRGFGRGRGWGGRFGYGRFGDFDFGLGGIGGGPFDDELCLISPELCYGGPGIGDIGGRLFGRGGHDHHRGIHARFAVNDDHRHAFKTSNGAGRAGGKTSRTPRASGGHGSGVSRGGAGHSGGSRGIHPSGGGGHEVGGRDHGGVHPTGDRGRTGDDRGLGRDHGDDRIGRIGDRDYDRDYDRYYGGGIYGVDLGIGGDPCLDPLWAETHPVECGLVIGRGRHRVLFAQTHPGGGVGGGARAGAGGGAIGGAHIGGVNHVGSGVHVGGISGGHDLGHGGIGRGIGGHDFDRGHFDPLRFHSDRFQFIGSNIWDAYAGAWLPWSIDEYDSLLLSDPDYICELYPELCMGELGGIGGISPIAEEPYAYPELMGNIAPASHEAPVTINIEGGGKPYGPGAGGQQHWQHHHGSAGGAGRGGAPGAPGYSDDEGFGDDDSGFYYDDSE